MYRAWLGLKALAWAWLWWAWAFKILSQARTEGLPKPRAWLGLKPGLVYHIWLYLPKASKCWNKEPVSDMGTENTKNSPKKKKDYYLIL